MDDGIQQKSDAEDASEYARDVRKGWADAEERLEHLQERIILVERELKSSRRLSDHLLYGVGRRVRLLRRALENIFTLFPPETRRPLPTERLLDAQINLHAFSVNAYAVSDNWAWAFVLRHGLSDSLPKKFDVGLFAKPMSKYLPAALREYLQSDDLLRWRTEYAKFFRDATAHQVPPYIPPYAVKEQDQALHAQLAELRQKSIREQDWAGAEDYESQMNEIRHPLAAFYNTAGADVEEKGVFLHAQLASDALTVAEIGERFLDLWHERAAP